MRTSIITNGMIAGLLSAGILALGLSGALNEAVAKSAPKVVQTSNFNIVYSGIRIGKIGFTIEIDGDGYTLSAKGRTDGVARLFSRGKGSFSSEGKFEGVSVISAVHEVQVTEKGKTAKLAMSFDNGNLKDVTISPKKKPRTHKNTVPVLAEHLKSIIDPASSIVVPTVGNATSGRDVCERTLNVFDGETRFDIELTYKSTRPISAKGFKGLAYVCRLMYVPVAGHREGQKYVELMRKNKDMEIWLAPIAGTSVYTPIKIDVESPVGRFIAYPKVFSAEVVGN